MYCMMTERLKKKIIIIMWIKIYQEKPDASRFILSKG